MPLHLQPSPALLGRCQQADWLGVARVQADWFQDVGEADWLGVAGLQADWLQVAGLQTQADWLQVAGLQAQADWLHCHVVELAN